MTISSTGLQRAIRRRWHAASPWWSAAAPPRISFIAHLSARRPRDGDRLYRSARGRQIDIDRRLYRRLAHPRPQRRRRRRRSVQARSPAGPFSATACGCGVMPEDPCVFIRSGASHGHLGGLSESIHRIVDAMDAAGRDFIIIETVGAGQSENPGRRDRRYMRGGECAQHGRRGAGHEGRHRRNRRCACGQQGRLAVCATHHQAAHQHARAAPAESRCPGSRDCRVDRDRNRRAARRDHEPPCGQRRRQAQQARARIRWLITD